MLNALEKNKKRDPKHMTVLSSISPTIRKQKGLFRWRLIFWLIFAIVVFGFIGNNNRDFVFNLKRTFATVKSKIFQKRPRSQPTKKVITPAVSPTKSAIKLQSITLAQQENQTILDFNLSSPTTYYIEHSPDQQKLFITLSNTGLLGNLPVALENTFLMTLDTKQNKDNTTITVTLLPGTEIDETRLITEPKPSLHLVFSNPQLTNSRMSKTSTPLSPEQQKIDRLKEIQGLLARHRTDNAIHKLRLFIGDFPGNLQARTLLVTLLLKNGRTGKAQEILSNGLKRNPAYIPFVKLKARILMKNNKLAATMRLLEKHLASNDAELLAILAVTYQQQGKFISAAEIYNQLSKAQPQNVKWWIGLGVALESANKINAAKEAYRQAYNTPHIPSELRAFLTEKVKR